MVPRVAGKGASFKGAALYYLHDKGALTSERVAFTHTVNLTTDDPERAWREMASTAMRADLLKARAGLKASGRKMTDPVYTYSLAWHPEQRPERAQMIAAAQASLEHLGFAEHEAVFVAHSDEPHRHIHVIVNRVHPETGKAHNPSKDYLRLSDWAEAYEREHGHIYCEERVLNNERRRAGERAKDEASLEREAFERQAAEEARSITPANLVTNLARHQAHFTAEDLKRAAQNQTAANPDPIVREALEDPRLVKLYDGKGRLAGYTTKAIRAQEEATLARAERLAVDLRHGVNDMAMIAAMERRTLDAEQQAAMVHALEPGALKVIEGQAGTGKSYTMEAIAEAARIDGYRVVGLAKTNTVAGDMGKSGAFSDTRSLNSLVWWTTNKPEDERARVDRDTMLVIDEAAMVETRLLNQVTELAEARGAKVILVGHDRQLAAVEYGGVFTDIAGKVGSAELTTVRRQEADWQRQASSDMANGRFAEALSAFDRLNAALQDVEIARGRVGNLQTLEAHDGALTLGEGDRIAFKGTDKRRNILNGSLGTVEAIEGTRLTVQADAGHRITFDTEGPEAFRAFRLGYAGTIYSGQGKTLDQAYVLHTKHWRDASTYVALTRARADTQMFVARDECTGWRQGSHFDHLVRQIERQAHRGSSLQFSTAPPELAPKPDAAKEQAREAFDRAAQPEPDQALAKAAPDPATHPLDSTEPAPSPSPEAQETGEMQPRPGMRHEDRPQTQGQREAAWEAERRAAIPAHEREVEPPRPPEPERRPLPEGVVDRDAEGRLVYPSPEAQRQYPNPYSNPDAPPRPIDSLPADAYARAVKARQAEDAAHAPEHGDRSMDEKRSSKEAFTRAADPAETAARPDVSGSDRAPRLAGVTRLQPTGPMANQAAVVNARVEHEAEAKTPPPPRPEPSRETPSASEAFRAMKAKHAEIATQEREGRGHDHKGPDHDGPTPSKKGLDFER